MKGSFSIESVAGHRPELDYAAWANSEGTAAQVAYLYTTLEPKTSERKADLEAKLRVYCKKIPGDGRSRLFSSATTRPIRRQACNPCTVPMDSSCQQTRTHRIKQLCLLDERIQRWIGEAG